MRQASLAAPLFLLLANASAEPLDCAGATKAPVTTICADPLLSSLVKEGARLVGLAATGADMTAERRRELASSDASSRKTLSACKDAKPCLQRTLIEHIQVVSHDVV